MGELEHLILIAILKLGPEAFGARIRESIADAGGRRITRGALYRALDRLGEKRFVVWNDVAGTADRGGHTRRRFRLTRAGLAAVRDRRAILLRLWDGVEPELEGR